MVKTGFNVIPGERPFVRVMFGDAAAAVRVTELLLTKGIFVVAFSYPVVPHGKARIRIQVSAAHMRADLEYAIAQFVQVRGELGL